jgi:hypothetical protein
MAVDVRSRYFAEPEEFFMPDNGAMSPSFSVLPQYELPNNNFMVMPPAAAPYAEQQYLPAAQPIMQQPAAAPYAAPYAEPYQYTPAVQPMTQEAAAPYDLSGLDLSSLAGLDLSGLNFGSNFGGGAMGGQYQPDPNVQYINAPLSNKGNPTSQTGGNTFAVKVDQPVRLVDHRTNQVVFEGTGFDAARKATELGQGLTDQFGRKANYSIQTADPTGAYNTVAYEKKNKSTLGTIANIAGTALPLALIPLTAGASAGSLLASTAGKIGLGAALGGVGSALKGDNILKGAAMGGLSAAGGQLLGGPLSKIGASNIGLRAGTAIGTGLGSTAGGLATGQNLKSALLGGVASGALSYLTPDIVKGLGLNQGPVSGTSTSTGESVDTSADFGGPNAEIIATGVRPFTTPNINLGGFKTPTQKYLDDAASDNAIDPATGLPYEDLIKVTGYRPGAVTPGVNLGGSPGDFAVKDQFDQPETEEPGDEDTIKVTGYRPGAVTPGINFGALTGGPTVNPAVNNTDQIVVTGYRPGAVTPGVNLGGLTLTPTEVAPKSAEEQAKEDEERKKLGVSDYLRLASLAAGLIGGGGGGGGGGGAAGSQAINPIFSAKLPTPGAGGAFKVGGLDYTTPPARSAADMYRYAMGPAMDIPAGMDLRGATSPYAGYGPGTLGEETFKRVTGMAQGGAMGYARGSSRDSFAVDGPGTGRSDDIPAVLSDGEYVIDAETVALLGDGSSKAGAKKLDEMRVKVRKHKGRNLAKGKFSVNAKRPEKYLSGGRT